MKVSKTAMVWVLVIMIANLALQTFLLVLLLV